MNTLGSGFIIIINYASSISAEIDEFAILTESNQAILTETGNEIDIEH